MNKEELKNAIVEMNLLKLISDKELIMLNNRINKHFLNYPHPDETTKVSTNKQPKEYLKMPKGCNSLECLHPDKNTCDGCNAYF